MPEKQVIGEAPLPPDPDIRFQAGAASWKIVCPPAGCLNPGQKFPIQYKDWHHSQPRNFQGGFSKSSQKAASSLDRNLFKRARTRVGCAAHNHASDLPGVF